jgi:hypothetical protein
VSGFGWTVQWTFLFCFVVWLLAQAMLGCYPAYVVSEGCQFESVSLLRGYKSLVHNVKGPTRLLTWARDCIALGTRPVGTR